MNINKKETNAQLTVWHKRARSQWTTPWKIDSYTKY